MINKSNKLLSLTKIYVLCLQRGQISEEAASIRALLDLCDLITVMPVERAIKRTIIDKLEDEREQQAIYNAVGTKLLKRDKT